MPSLTSPLESWETRARVAEGGLATCSHELSLMTERLARQEKQEQKLQVDLVSRELVLTSLKVEVLACKGRLENKEQELVRLKQESQGVKEQSEALLQEAIKEKTHMSSQLNGVRLVRDTLEVEAGTLKEEVAKLRGQEEVAQLHVAKISRGIEQLVSRLASRELEVTDLRLRAESLEGKVRMLEGEVRRLEGVAEDWKLKVKGEEGRAREVQEELALRQGEIEGLDEVEVANLWTQNSETPQLAESSSRSQVEELSRSEINLAGTRIQELSPLANKLRMELVVERLGKEVSTSTELLAEKEVGEQRSASDSVALEVDGLKYSTTRASQGRAITPPPASSPDTLQLSLKRPVDIEADFDHQKKARSNIITEVLGGATGQGGGSLEKESDMGMEVDGGEERGQVSYSSQCSRDLELEEEGLSGEQEENNNRTLAARTKEGVEVGSSPLQTLEHVCHGCQSVFTQTAALHHHQAVAGRCKRMKDLDPQEFSCHRCFRKFNSKSNWSRHNTFVLNCLDKKNKREDRMVEEASLLEVHGPGEELCLETPAEVDSFLEVLPAGSGQSLPGQEVEEAPVGGPEIDHCYARSSTVVPEHRPSSHNPAQPSQVNS